ncbi:30S ribosomal protein S17 [bacterium AB1]|nr:30S ribosomal protein S17 [bacterium AB1]
MNETNYKILSGNVVKISGNKTVKVVVNRYRRHPKYQKIVKITKKYLVHDEYSVCSVGNNVQIILCRPISKNKTFRLYKINKLKNAYS